MRQLLYLLALAPTLAQADTFAIDTKVSEVTVYPEGAEVIRTGLLDIPAGRHRLVLLGVPANDTDTQLATMQVHAEGLTQTALVVRGDDVPWHDYASDDIKQAEQRIEDIKDKIVEVQDRADAALLKADAARHKIAFLANLGSNEGLAGSDANSLREIARMVGDEGLSAEETVQSAEIEARTIRKELDDLKLELEAAQDDLAALIPETDERLFLAVDVIADSAINSTVSVSYLDFYSANWVPGYEFDLTTGDAPEVTINRQIRVNQSTGENWKDITLHVSTLQPVGQNSASPLYPQRRSIREEPKAQYRFASLAEGVVEAPVVVEETSQWVPSAASVQGTGITYTLPEPVSIASDHELAEFELDSMTQSAEVYALAIPLRDETAFRTARFTNPYKQNLLTAPLARWRVNGVLVATEYSPEIGPSEQVEMGFGPLYGVTVDRRILDRSSGDTGLISRSNQRVERAQITVENLTDRTWPLRLVDRVPYSEQEDLEISWTANPRPTEENVDDKRGILAWDMDLAPGQSEIILLDQEINWPEGMVLD